MKIIPMKIRFLGSAREVGRAAIAVKSEKNQLLLDYGVMLATTGEPGPCQVVGWIEHGDKLGR